MCVIGGSGSGGVTFRLSCEVFLSGSHAVGDNGGTSSFSSSRWDGDRLSRRDVHALLFVVLLHTPSGRRKSGNRGSDLDLLGIDSTALGGTGVLTSLRCCLTVRQAWNSRTTATPVTLVVPLLTA